MYFHRKWTTVVAVGIGIGSLLITGRFLAQVVGKRRLSCQSEAFLKALVDRLTDPLPSTTIVSSNIEWESVYEEILRDCATVPILGFDCEWVNQDGNVHPVALIQIATHSGRCILVRLSSMSYIPDSLKALMADPGILKVGVATCEDAIKLEKDYGLQVRGVFDVRRLIHKHPLRETLKSGLSGLSEQLLGVKLNKHFSIRCSDWEAEILTITQIKYASQDALASLAICLKLVSDTQTDHGNNVWSFSNLESFYSSWARTVPFLDTNFYKPFSSSSSNNKKYSLNGAESRGKLVDPSNSKRAFYANCILQSPDGQELCPCFPKKALWYVRKGRGVLISESPVMTVRLNFEPSGRPTSEYDINYLRDKTNACVVCGKQESLLSENIVPYEYCKHFPVQRVKYHKNHDVLLLCLDCRADWNSHVNVLSGQLAGECDAPVGTEKDLKMKLNQRLEALKRAARALLDSRHSMPAERIAHLESKVIEYFGLQETESLSQEILERATNLKIRISNEDFVPHGLRVVRYFEEKHTIEQGLLVLERLWREHFLKTMKPKHLPYLWSIDHNRKPEEKWSAVTTTILSL